MNSSEIAFPFEIKNKARSAWAEKILSASTLINFFSLQAKNKLSYKYYTCD